MTRLITIQKYQLFPYEKSLREVIDLFQGETYLNYLGFFRTNRALNISLLIREEIREG